MMYAMGILLAALVLRFIAKYQEYSGKSADIPDSFVASEQRTSNPSIPLSDKNITSYSGDGHMASSGAAPSVRPTVPDVDNSFLAEPGNDDPDVWISGINPGPDPDSEDLSRSRD